MSITVEKTVWLDHPRQGGAAMPALAPTAENTTIQPDLVAMAEQEADRTNELARLAEIGAVAADEAMKGAEVKPEHSPTLAPLAVLAAEKSQDAANKATVSAKTVDDLGSLVRQEVGDGTIVDADAVPRVREASSRATKSAERAGASARRAVSAADRVKSILSEFEPTRSKSSALELPAHGRDGVTVQLQRSPRGSSDRKPLSPPTSAAQPISAKSTIRKAEKKEPKKGLMSRILDVFSD